MASQGNELLYKGIPNLEGAFVVIVKTEWNAPLVNELAAGAKKVLDQHNVQYEVITVPGAIEIPFAIQRYHTMLSAHAYIALGTVVRGDTPHFDYVCQSVTQGITTLNTQLDAPVIFGILTVNDEQQAHERIGGKHGHKGEEAAVTALKMMALNNKLSDDWEEKKNRLLNGDF